MVAPVQGEMRRIAGAPVLNSKASGAKLRPFSDNKPLRSLKLQATPAGNVALNSNTQFCWSAQRAAASAAKLAGVSEPQVRITLNLEKRFEDKPVLKNILLNGEVSINKLARVAAIATSENQEDLADKVKLLSKNALEVFVRDEKFVTAEHRQGGVGAQNGNGLNDSLFDDKSLPGQTSPQLDFQLSNDVVRQLNELNFQGHDVNQLLSEMLELRKQQIQTAKNEISENIQPAKSRYIPAEIKKIIKQEFGDKCAILNCKTPYDEIHHKQRFSLYQSHDPNLLIPLCKGHHEITHTVDVKYNEIRRRAVF